MLREFHYVIVADDELKDDLAGSTANIVLVKNNKIYCVSCQSQFVSEI